MNITDKGLLEDFIQESLTLLDDAKEPLNGEECSAEGVNLIFRCLHTLKGTSGFLDLMALSGFIHKVEDFVRDKQEVKSGLSPEEGECLMVALSLMGDAVINAGTPEFLEQPAFEEVLANFNRLRYKDSSLSIVQQLIEQITNEVKNKSIYLEPVTLIPAVDALKVILAKIKIKEERTVIPVDYKSIEKLSIDGKDFTAIACYQLEALEAMALGGKESLYKLDLVDVFAGLDEIISFLPNKDEVLTWDVITDVYDTMPEVIIQAFDRFWAQGLDKCAKIVWKKSPRSAKQEEPTISTVPSAPKESGEEDFFRISGKVLQDVAKQVGSLVANRNNFENLIQEIGPKLPSEYREHLKDSYSDLDNTVNDLELKVSSLNNRSLRDIFQRLPGQVSRLAKDLGKDIVLNLSGEDIEIPRGLVKSLQDPLVHIVRNSVDHGIEPPEDRKEINKDPRGKMDIFASRDDGLLKISISDDGKGIDPEQIRSKALKKGLLTAETDISEHDLQMMVFAPGFSTNEEATSVSGRGVGMDVVRTAVESGGGRLQLVSKVGQGTTIDLYLPLDMGSKTRDVQLVRIGGDVYGIEYRSLVEVIRGEDITLLPFKNKTYLDYRGDLLHFVNLGEFLYGNDLAKEQLERIIIIEDEQHQRLACGVSGIKYKVKVVVSRFEQEFLAANMVFGGSAVVGTGKPILVFNFSDIYNYL